MSIEPQGDLSSDDTVATPAEDTIALDMFLKLANVVQSGGQAKHLIQSGGVMVNGAVEVRRGRKLRPGDSVEVNGEQFVIESDGL
jgi:ribosome-associated protein